MQITVKEVAAGGAGRRASCKAGDVITTRRRHAGGRGRQRLLELIRAQAGRYRRSQIGITRAGTAGDRGGRRARPAPTASPRIGITADVSPTAPFTVKIPIENIGGPSRRADAHPRHHRQDRAGGPHRREDHRRYRHHRRRRQRRPDRRDAAEAGRRAQDAGATFFLTPADNCAEAVANQPAGLPLVRGGARSTTR